MSRVVVCGSREQLCGGDAIDLAGEGAWQLGDVTQALDDDPSREGTREIPRGEADVARVEHSQDSVGIARLAGQATRDGVLGAGFLGGTPVTNTSPSAVTEPRSPVRSQRPDALGVPAWADSTAPSR